MNQKRQVKQCEIIAKRLIGITQGVTPRQTAKEMVESSLLELTVIVRGIAIDLAKKWPQEEEDQFKDPRHFKKWGKYRNKEIGVLVDAVQWYRNDTINIEGFQQVEVDSPDDHGPCAVAFVPGVDVPIVSGEFILKFPNLPDSYGRLSAGLFFRKYEEVAD